MFKTLTIGAFALCFGLSAIGSASAHSPASLRTQHNSFQGADLSANSPAFNASGAGRTANAIPDWTVQYGIVTNPRGASGSFGAMLEGRNPAANAVP